ncbi:MULTISPECIES: endolytic transglycosylase MltG [Clostridium]|uniref:Endolytic murein transglycosylase n=1 Tax=Clostridium cibarium TaxID=2762247 RepID=A0ABR8PQB7_9CLOT|nr:MULTISPECIES: endolytic transglycosylase MltG [Clostridium]MBD7910363.1 endolytic transglycosylase MltG [Clostridium cibarium]
MKKNTIKIKFSRIITIIIAILLGGAYYYNSIVSRPLKSNNDTIEINVGEGEAFNSILDKLDKEGNLRNKFIVKLSLKISYKTISLFPGEYEIKKDSSLEELIKSLEAEDSSKNQVAISIPEGYSIESIANRFEENGLFSKDEFLNEAKQYEVPKFVKADKNKKYNLEGYLYPDTYFFDKGVTPKEVINTMLNNFQVKMKEISDETGKTIDDNEIETIITKASLVEKEAVLDDERPKVASVIENRLKKGMKLEFCSTVNYVVGYDKKVVLTNSDISVESPYNTYKYGGLPIGPIASPGKESILAVLNPESTNYLYFLSLRGQGGKQYFSESEKEHNDMKKKQGY